MGQIRDITGQKFGRLTAIELVSTGPTIWKFRCDCKTVKDINCSNVTTGKVVSCGCSAKAKDRNDRLYSIWRNIKQRCNNPRHESYLSYGGRGISVCTEWGKDFFAFESWALSNGYQSDLTIDRIDNNQGYYPGNCRWADKETQQNNTRRNKHLTAWGETKTLTQWTRDPRCVLTDIHSIYKRLKRGMTAEEALASQITDLPRLVTAWGETKTVMEWTKDDRCAVEYQCLIKRLEAGRLDNEEAISTPPRQANLSYAS